MKPKVLFRKTVVGTSLVATFVIVGFAGQSALAADLVLKGSDGGSISSFTSPLTGAAPGWVTTAGVGTGVAATAGNNYFTSFTLRTPQAAGAFTFAGDALTINAGGTLFIKSNSNSAGNIITVNNLILNGGVVGMGFGTNDSFSATVAGAINVTGNSNLSAQGGGNGSNVFETLVIAAPISGAAGTTLTIASSGLTGNNGVVRFNAANTYRGTVTVATPSSGSVASSVNRILQLNNLDAVQNATLNLVSVANGLSFLAASNTGVYKIGALSGTSNQALTDTASAAVAVNVGSNDSSTTYSGILSGIGSLSKSGTGTLTVTGANSQTGVTTINAGILNTSTLAAVNTASGIGKGSVAGSAADLVFGGGTLQYNTAAVATTNRLFTLGNASGLTATLDSSAASTAHSMSFTGTGALAFGGSGARTLTFSGNNTGNNTFAPIIGDGTGGTTAVTKSGAGTWILAGSNTYLGATQVSNGTLLVNGSLAAGSSVNVDSGASLGGGVGGTAGTINGAATSAGTITPGGTGAIGTLAFGNNLTLNGGAITLDLSGTSNSLGGATNDLFTVAGNLTASGIVLVNPTFTGGTPAPNTVYQFGSYNGTLTGGASFVAGSRAITVSIATANQLNLTYTGASSGNLTWNSTLSGVWNVVASQNWFNTGTNAQDYFYIGDAVTFDNTSGVQTAITLNSNLAPLSTTVDSTTNNFSFSGSGGIGGTGGLIKSGASTLTINTANTYTGATSVNGGTFVVGSAGSLSATAITVASAATFNLDGSLAGTPLTVDAGATFTESATGIISGSAALTTSGTTTLAGNNTRTGTTALNGGTLNLNSATALGSDALTINGGTIDNTSGSAKTLTTNNVQSWNGDFGFTGSNNLDLGTGDVTLGGVGSRAVTLTANTLTVGEIKSSSQGLSISGAGTLVATSIGTTTAGSNIGGILDVGAGTTLQINRSTGNSTATTGDFVATGLTGSGTITNGAASTRSLVVGSTASTTFAGTLANGGTAALNLTKQGSGTLTLTGSSSYTGTTAVTTGIINVQNSNALGSSQVSVRALTAGIQLQGGISLPGTVTFLTSNGGTGAVGYAIANLSGNNTINGVITMTDGAGDTVIQSDADTLTLAGNITSDRARGLILQGASTGANTVSGIISNGTSGINTVTKTGTGTWTLASANTYTGATTINAGKLSISSVANGGAASNIGQSSNTAANLVLGGGTLQYTGATASTDRAFTLTTGTTSSIEVSSANANLTISGAGAATNGSLVKTGAGTLTLTGANGHTGSTTVSGGTLASGAAGGTLGGSVIVQSDAILAAGGAGTVGSATVGTPVTGSTTFNSGSIFSWDLNVADSTDTASTTTFDKLATASVAGDGGAVFHVVLGGSENFGENFWNVSHSWNNIFTTNGTDPVSQNLATIFTSFTFANANGSPTTIAPTTGSFAFNGSTLEFSAVPEPTSAIAGLLLGAGLMRRNRRNCGRTAV